MSHNLQIGNTPSSQNMGDLTREQYDRSINLLVGQIFNTIPELKALESFGVPTHAAIVHDAINGIKKAMRAAIDDLAPYQPGKKTYALMDVATRLSISKYLSPRFQRDTEIRKGMRLNESEFLDYTNDLSARIDGAFYQQLLSITQPEDA